MNNIQLQFISNLKEEIQILRTKEYLNQNEKQELKYKTEYLQDLEYKQKKQETRNKKQIQGYMNILIKYDSKCVSCNTVIDRKTRAWWSEHSKRLLCGHCIK